jgi:hypothetical protein
MDCSQPTLNKLNLPKYPKTSKNGPKRCNPQRKRLAKYEIHLQKMKVKMLETAISGKPLAKNENGLQKMNVKIFFCM